MTDTTTAAPVQPVVILVVGNDKYLSMWELGSALKDMGISYDASNQCYWPRASARTFPRKENYGSESEYSSAVSAWHDHNTERAEQFLLRLSMSGKPFVVVIASNVIREPDFSDPENKVYVNVVAPDLLSDLTSHAQQVEDCGKAPF